MTQKRTLTRGFGQVSQRDIASLRGYQLEELNKERRFSPVPTPESFTADPTKNNEAYEKAATAGRVAVVGAERKGYAMPIDEQLAAAQAEVAKYFLSNLRRSLVRSLDSVLDLSRGLRAVIPDAPSDTVFETHPGYPGANYVVTGWPAPAEPLTRQEAVDKGLLAPDMGYAFYEGPIPGVESDADAGGWTPERRQMARDLLALQEGFGYPDGPQPPDTPFTNIDEPPRAQQEQPRGEQ